MIVTNMKVTVIEKKNIGKKIIRQNLSLQMQNDNANDIVLTFLCSLFPDIKII